MITKLIGSQPDWWPDLLGPVALAYNSTVHTSTGFAPHELFYSFPPSCALDAMIDVAREEPARKCGPVRSTSYRANERVIRPLAAISRRKLP